MDELVKSGIKPKSAISKALAFERKMKRESAPEEKTDQIDPAPEAVLVEAEKEIIASMPLDQAALDAIALRKQKRRFVK